MKTLKSSTNPNLAELSITAETAKYIFLYSYKIWIILLTVWFICILTKVHAQNGPEDQPTSVSNNSSIRIADFVKDLAQAEKLPSYINSSFKEIGPLVSPDGKTLFFSRQNHPDNTGGVLDYEDIWYSKYNDIMGMWSMPDRMSAPINNYGPNSVNFVSLTGDTLVLANKYLKHGKMAAGLSMSVLEHGCWSFPQTFKINDQLNLSNKFNISISYNKQIILTSEERDDTYGGGDIYITLLYPDGSQSSFNLGSSINTDKDESSPFLAPDYKTLYFASKGHKGFGGFDIFVSHRLDETWQNWSEPENLGPGINSVNNEEFFNFTFDGHYAYFSKEVSEDNTDIYRVSLKSIYERQDQLKDNSRDNNNMVNVNSAIQSMGLGDVIVTRFAHNEK